MKYGVLRQESDSYRRAREELLEADGALAASADAEGAFLTERRGRAEE